ncbi:hypothetical protein [Micromonospora chalcea]|nr:hypothetical protein [Micromonospora chalcea]
MPARVEPPSGYEPPRPEPVRPYEPLRAEPAAGPEPTRPYESEPARQHEPGAATEPAREATRPFRLARGDGEPPHGYERPAWAGPPVPVPPVNPATGPEPAGAPPAPVSGYTPTFPGYPSAPAGPPPAAAPVANPATRATGETGDGPRQPPTAPVRPISGVSARPTSGVPAQATSGVPAGPNSGLPAQPNPGVPARPTSGVPAGPVSDVPAPPVSGGPTRPISGIPAPRGAAHADRTSAPQPASAPPYAARRSAPEPVPAADAAAEPRPEEPAPVVLPQRVPAEPDVPVVPEPPAVEPSAETPELARIATHLRRDDEPAPLRERPEGFDVNAILDAVREVAGVRDAALRRTPAGAHSLRLDLADGADPAEVSRLVARLLQERMGLAAAPQNLPGPPVAPPPGWQQPPKRTRRRRRWPWVLLLTVACCCGLPLWWFQPISSQYPARASLPDQIDSMRLRQDERSQAAAEELKSRVRESNLLAEDTFAGIYTTNDGKRVTLFGSTGLRFSPESDAKSEIDRLAGEYALKESVSVETGVRGRYARCAVGRADGDSVVVCTSADHGSLTTGVFTRLSVDDSGRLLNDLRQRVVVPKS